MYGAFIGDIVGSKYEFDNIKTMDFPLFSVGCAYTDDSIMTAAVAQAIMASRRDIFEHGPGAYGFSATLTDTMREFGKRYPHPKGSYGGRFARWLREPDPKPYQSYGNGSAMRVSPCGLAAVTLEEAIALAKASSCVTHDHPEGIKGAEAVAAAVFMAKTGSTKDEIGRYINENYYPIDFTIDGIRETYKFDETCQGSVPQAIEAFLESESFEDAIRRIISIGGDCDTTGAITGAIAWSYYAVGAGRSTEGAEDELDPAMREIKECAEGYLPAKLRTLADEFRKICVLRAGTYERSGLCTPIMLASEN